MRYFDSILFCGAGRFSEADCRLLKRQLRDALSVLSGIQQGGGDQINAQELDIREDVVRDVAAALLGKRVAIGPDLPYPGKWSGTRQNSTGKRVREVHAPRSR